MEEKKKEIIEFAMHKNGVSENTLHPYIAEKLSLFCDQLIQDNPNAGEGLLKGSAASTLAMMIQSPKMNIPRVKIE